MSDTKWADIENDDDYDVDSINTQHLMGFESTPDVHGIKTVTSYSKNRQGQTVKVRQSS